MADIIVRVSDKASSEGYRLVRLEDSNQSMEQIVRALYERGVFDENQWFPGTSIEKVVFKED